MENPVLHPYLTLNGVIGNEKHGGKKTAKATPLVWSHFYSPTLRKRLYDGRQKMQNPAVRTPMKFCSMNYSSHTN